jgi:hypothetical protein
MSGIPPGTPAAAFCFSGGSAMTASVVMMVFAIEAAFWSAEPGHHRRIDDSGLEEVLVRAALDAEPVALPERVDLVDDDVALQARAAGEPADRLLERARDDRRARLLGALGLAPTTTSYALMP